MEDICGYKTLIGMREVGRFIENEFRIAKNYLWSKILDDGSDSITHYSPFPFSSISLV